VFENRVLRRIFGPKREEEAGGWRTMHNEEWIHMAQNRIHGNRTSGSIKGGEFLD
jgi:hypothetical protein